MKMAAYMTAASSPTLFAAEAQEARAKRATASASPDQKAGVTSPAAGNPFDFHLYGPRNFSFPSWRDLIRSNCMKTAAYMTAASSSTLFAAEAQEARAERATASASPDQKAVVTSPAAGNPFDFHVYGPRNFSFPSWRDLIRSNWKDPNYRRMVFACLVQAAYLLELDRQEERTEQSGLAPQWWKPFLYKLAQVLVDPRDGSVYGAVFEWDRRAALSAYVPVRPSGAPCAVVALRGTLLRAPTARRDLEDDVRFLAWDSLKGSVRFAGALEALRAAARKHGGGNVCLAGHSLGAGFALQVGKALAKEGVFVECHVFNPPSVSVAMTLRGFSERALQLWGMVRARLPRRLGGVEEKAASGGGGGGVEHVVGAEKGRWVPHLYINTSDYVCCYYNDAAAGTAVATSVGGGGPVAKVFVAAKGPRRFLEAHGLQQWWADDVELQLALSHSKLVNRQLRSLYAAQPSPSVAC